MQHCPWFISFLYMQCIQVLRGDRINIVFIWVVIKLCFRHFKLLHVPDCILSICAQYTNQQSKSTLSEMCTKKRFFQEPKSFSEKKNNQWKFYHKNHKSVSISMPTTFKGWFDVRCGCGGPGGNGIPGFHYRAPILNVKTGFQLSNKNLKRAYVSYIFQFGVIGAGPARVL